MILVDPQAAVEFASEHVANGAYYPHQGRDRELKMQVREVTVRSGRADVQIPLMTVMAVSLKLDKVVGQLFQRTDYRPDQPLSRCMNYITDNSMNKSEIPKI